MMLAEKKMVVNFIEKWKIFKKKEKKKGRMHAQWKLVAIDLLKLDLFKNKKEKLKN